ncbi:hypothetical protein NC653_003687 [Populus alba x Populus x berolinensis]|uniref:Uncharacterized protein n=1 Tax=Populus alba x Populus x berolinensis TaxID=444605 RepID=A0AAD6RS54_9ROSI|nr:hypothetical protein NC653_003687 [Populus alba x Populus x berolinensis]
MLNCLQILNLLVVMLIARPYNQMDPASTPIPS